MVGLRRLLYRWGCYGSPLTYILKMTLVGLFIICIYMYLLPSWPMSTTQRLMVSLHKTHILPEESLPNNNIHLRQATKTLWNKKVTSTHTPKLTQTFKERNWQGLMADTITKTNHFKNEIKGADESMAHNGNGEDMVTPRDDTLYREVGADGEQDDGHNAKKDGGKLNEERVNNSWSKAPCPGGRYRQGKGPYSWQKIAEGWFIFSAFLDQREVNLSTIFLMSERMKCEQLI